MKTLKTNCLTQAGCAMPDFLRLILICSITVMGLQQTLGQQRTPIPERNIQLPKFYGLYAIHQGKTIPLQGATEPLNFGPYVEFLLFSKNVAFLERWKLYQLPTRQQQQRLQQTAPKKRGGLTDFLNQSEDFSRENEAQLSGIPVGSIELTLLTMPVANQPEMVRIMTTGFLLSGPYQIGDQENWYRFSISGKPNETTNQSSSKSNEPNVNEFEAANSDAKAGTSSSPTAKSDVEPSPPKQGQRRLSQWEIAMKPEQERINRFDDSISRQLGNLMSDAQAKQGEYRWTETVSACAKILAIDPDNAYAHWMSGRAYARLEQLELAEEHLSKAMQLIPDDFRPYSEMFIVYAKRGATNDAIASLETAVRKGSFETYALRTDKDVPNNFKQLARFKELTAASLDRLAGYYCLDLDVFENRTEDLQMNYDAAWNAVEKALKSQSERIRISHKTSGFILTTPTAHGLFSGTMDQYIVVLESSGDATSRLHFKLMTWDSTTDDSGMRSVKPRSKPLIANRAAKFIDNVKKAAPKKK